MFISNKDKIQLIIIEFMKASDLSELVVICNYRVFSFPCEGFSVSFAILLGHVQNIDGNDSHAIERNDN